VAIPLEILEALGDAGCTVEQLLAAIRADRDRLARLRAERAMRKAALQGQAVPVFQPVNMNKADSVAAVESALPEGEAAAPIVVGGYHKAVARTALLSTPGLRPAAKLVGAVLVECHNVRTGRCDPGIAFIASRTGLSGRSVRRAIVELEGEGLLRRRIHGGRFHVNAYEIAWAALEALAGVGGNRKPQMNKADSGAAFAPMRTLASAEPDRRVRQNESQKQNRSVDGERPRAKPNPAQREFLYPLQPPRGDIAHGKAGQRLWDGIRANFSGEALGEMIERLSEELHERAVVSEMRVPGSGIILLLSELRRETGPPAAAAGG
jgi:DNA-binding transcriptional ArsR family regulator